MMLRRQSSRLSTTDDQKGKRKVLRNRRKGYEKKQVQKEGVSHEPGGLSTRFVFFLIYFIAHLSCLKLLFFQLSSGTQNTISLSSLTSPQPVDIFTKLGVVASHGLNLKNGLFSQPWLHVHQGLCSWITWTCRSHYPTSMPCGESCSRLMGKLEVHALHYRPLVWDMGFLSGHQNHVTKIVCMMLSNNQTLTGQTGKVEQENQQWTTIPARMMCNDSWVKILEQ